MESLYLNCHFLHFLNVRRHLLELSIVDDVWSLQNPSIPGTLSVVQSLKKPERSIVSLGPEPTDCVSLNIPETYQQ